MKRLLLLFLLPIAACSSSSDDDDTPAFVFNSSCGAYEDEDLVTETKDAILVTVEVVTTDRVIVTLPDLNQILVKFHGVSIENINPFRVTAGVDVLRSLVASGAYLVLAGDNCTFVAEDGGQGLLGQLFTRFGDSINETLIEQGYVEPARETCDTEGLSSCFEAIPVTERFPNQTELAVQAVEFPSTCGAVVNGTLVNPVTNAELVTVEVVSADEVIVTRQTGIEAGNSQLIQLHGLTIFGESAIRQAEGINYIRNRTAAGAYLVIESFGCTITTDGGGQGVVGQLYSLDGGNISEELLIEGFALPIQDECGGELIFDCYNTLAAEAPEVIEESGTTTSTPTTTTQTTNTVLNPNCNPPQGIFTERFGENGNLWKPESDTTGNLVLLFNNRYCETFDRCRVRRTNGEFEDLECVEASYTQNPFTCFSNIDRQTWRADFKCSSAAEVFATCSGPGVQVEFLAPFSGAGVCERHG